MPLRRSSTSALASTGRRDAPSTAQRGSWISGMHTHPLDPAVLPRTVGPADLSDREVLRAFADAERRRTVSKQ